MSKKVRCAAYSMNIWAILLTKSYAYGGNKMLLQDQKPLKYTSVTEGRKFFGKSNNYRGRAGSIYFSIWPQ